MNRGKSKVTGEMLPAEPSVRLVYKFHLLFTKGSRFTLNHNLIASLQGLRLGLNQKQNAIQRMKLPDTTVSILHSNKGCPVNIGVRSIFEFSYLPKRQDFALLSNLRAQLLW